MMRDSIGTRKLNVLAADSADGVGGVVGFPEGFDWSTGNGGRDCFFREGVPGVDVDVRGEEHNVYGRDLGALGAFEP